MNHRPIKIAAVLPRYGASIGGGAETLMRELLLSIVHAYPDTVVEVLTTCARDHRTWDNYYPEGLVIEDGIKVNRFKVSQRDISKFIAAEQKLAQGFLLSGDEQIEWLENSVNSRALYSYLLENAKNYDLVFYAPYLFGTSFWGPMIAPENAVLVPCLHDEAYAYLPVFRSLFRKVCGIMWNAEPEAKLANKIYRIPDLLEKGQVVGMGFESLAPVREKSLHGKPYVLYSGRKETGKNLDYLIFCYEEYRSRVEEAFDLLVIGSGSIDFLEKLPTGVIDKGFVSEEDKRRYFTHASLLVQPSVNESFSIVLMESWREGTPVLVHSDCAVTSYHVAESGGGMCFRSANEFTACLQNAWDTPDQLLEMAKNGAAYVKSEYSWDAVHKRFFDGIQKWKK